MDRYDERNVMFSRLNLKEDSREYNEYYQKNPHLKIIDDRLREVNFSDGLKENESFKSKFNPLISNNYLLYKTFYDVSNTFPIKKKIDLDSSFSKNIKSISKYYGALDVGIVELNDDLYYSHLGRAKNHVRAKNYNQLMNPIYKTAIVFSVPMDIKMINRAPMFEELLTAEEGYMKLAITGARLVIYLKSLGYQGFYNHSEYYLSPLVPLAYEAGIGDIGMCNHIVTEKYGNNIRLGAVFTDMKLDTDSPTDFGLSEFCKICNLCLKNCPSKAISNKTRIVQGRKFYEFDDAKCYEMWTKTGTDCGICIQSCPFTQGIDLKKYSKGMNDISVIKELLKEHNSKHGRRNYNKIKLDIVSSE